MEDVQHFVFFLLGMRLFITSRRQVLFETKHVCVCVCAWMATGADQSMECIYLHPLGAWYPNRRRPKTYDWMDHVQIMFVIIYNFWQLCKSSYCVPFSSRWKWINKVSNVAGTILCFEGLQLHEKTVRGCICSEVWCCRFPTNIFSAESCLV